MVAVAADGVGPLGDEAPLARRGVRAKARHLAPGQKAQPVRPVVPPRVFDLLVLARAVEAHRLRHLDVAAEVRVRWRGHEASGEVALVEHQSLYIWRAVEPEPAVTRLDPAHAEVALHAIDLVAPIGERDLEAIEVRGLGTPCVQAIERDGPAAFAPAYLMSVKGGDAFDLALRIDSDVDE